MAAPRGYRVIAEKPYERAKAQRGYTGKTLYVNVGTGAIEERPVTQEVKGVVADCNVGGYFGPHLKFAGWDAIEVQGKAKKDVIVVVDEADGVVRLLECPHKDVNTHVLSAALTRDFADSA